VRFTTNRVSAKNNALIYVARTSNDRAIAAHDLYYCLLPQCEALRTCRSGFPITTLDNLFFRCPGGFAVLESKSTAINSVPPNKSISDRSEQHIVLLDQIGFFIKLKRNCAMPNRLSATRLFLHGRDDTVRKISLFSEVFNIQQFLANFCQNVGPKPAQESFCRRLYNVERSTPQHFARASDCPTSSGKVKGAINFHLFYLNNKD